MDDDEIVELAREVINDVASRWEDSPEAFMLRDGDVITFTFTLPTENGSSSISINPLNPMIEIINFYLNKFPDKVNEFNKGTIRHSAITRLEMMLALTHQFYAESFKYLAHLAEEAIMYDWCNHFGTLHVWNTRFKALKSTFEKWPESFIKPKAIRQQPALVPVMIIGTVREDVRETGKRPSRNRVAQLLNVTPRALDKFAAAQGYKTFNKWLDVLFERDVILRKKR